MLRNEVNGIGICLMIGSYLAHGSPWDSMSALLQKKIYLNGSGARFVKGTNTDRPTQVACLIYNSTLIRSLSILHISN